MVEPVGIIGATPGLMGTTKAVADRVEYMAGERVRYNIPKAPFSRSEWTYAAFELNLRWTSAIFFCLGLRQSDRSFGTGILPQFYQSRRA